MQHEQYAALYHKTQLKQKWQKCFYELTKVNINILYFNSSSLRKVNDRNFRRLLSLFERTKYFQLDSLYHLFIVIKQAAFRSSIAETTLSIETIFNRNSSQWLKLFFSSKSKLVCLRDKYRIKIAKKYLSKSIRWWIINFCSKDKFKLLLNLIMLKAINNKA